MSFICQSANSSEVVTSCENDVVIGYFKRLFGEDFIASYYSSGSPALVDSALQSGDLNVIALSLQILAWFSILAACFILLIASYKWVIDSTNDDVAAGLAEESGVSIVGLLDCRFAWQTRVFNLDVISYRLRLCHYPPYHHSFGFAWQCWHQQNIPRHYPSCCSATTNKFRPRSTQSN